MSDEPHVSPDAAIALAFNQQAINILNIKPDFPRKIDVQLLAAEHLMRVFALPMSPVPVPEKEEGPHVAAPDRDGLAAS